jgi:DNA-binding transcriptional MocR family regulator
MDADRLAAAVGTLTDQRHRPLWERLADAIGALAEQGVLAVGEAIPSERSLAEALGVSRTTVSAAYVSLKDDGWLDTSPGRVARIVRRAKQPASLSPAERLDELFGSSSPAAATHRSDVVVDFAAAATEAAPMVRRALLDPASFVDDPDLLVTGTGYAPYGLPALIDAIVDELRRDGVDANAEEIVVTSGAQQALSLLAGALIGRNDPVGVEAFAYAGVFDAIASANGRAVSMPLRSDGIDVNASIRTVLAAQADVAFVSRFQNPTGTRLADDSAERLVRQLGRRGVTVIEDRTMSALALTGTPPTAMAALAPDVPSIVVGGVSKTMWGGLRIGWIRCNPTLAALLRDRRAAHDLGSPAMTQYLGAALLRNHHAAVIRWRVAQLRRALATLTAALDDAELGWTWRVPDGGPTLWVDLGAPVAAALTSAAARRGVPIVSGRALAAQPGDGESHIRIPFLRSAAELRTGIDLLAATWRALPHVNVRRATPLRTARAATIGA